MDTKKILEFCLEKGFLIDEDLLELFKEFEDIETTKLIIEKIKQTTKERIITKKFFNEHKEQVNEILLDLPKENQQAQKVVNNLKIKLGLTIQISKELSKEISRQAGVSGPVELDKPSTQSTEPEPFFELIVPPTIKTKPEMRLGIETNQELEGVKVLSSLPPTSKKLEVGDFVKHFRNRFSKMKNILQEYASLTNLVSVNKISGNRQISVIAMILSKRITKNKNILLGVEDLTGRTVALVNKNQPELYKKAEDLTLDSVVGLKCSGNSEIIFVNDIIFPDVALAERKKSPVDEYALFSGDMHVGSTKFMEENFLKFVDYLNGKVLKTAQTEKIKYLFLVGDLISGVGIYQGQEKELEIKDVEAQYEKVAELLSKIRRDIKIIICPGNHDALRIMEPQPLLDEKYAWPIYNLKNVILTTNPAFVNIGAKSGLPNSLNFSGFNVLMYHGYSFHYYADAIGSLMKEKAAQKPEKIMAYLLKNRHLAPTHASTLYFPSQDDPLLIEKAPDIFFSGHTHKSAVSYYNNILMLSSSSWESKTAFQEKMGNEPDFCKVPMFNLKTRAIKILDFE